MLGALVDWETGSWLLSDVACHRIGEGHVHWQRLCSARLKRVCHAVCKADSAGTHSLLSTVETTVSVKLVRSFQARR